jgi:regulator of protease activity HflC (stomatin/prohibitin superfamily)
MMATITVQEYERAVRLVDGRVRGVLDPGRHRYRRRRTQLHRFDLRTLQLAEHEGTKLRLTLSE